MNEKPKYGVLYCGNLYFKVEGWMMIGPEIISLAVSIHIDNSEILALGGVLVTENHVSVPLTEENEPCVVFPNKACQSAFIDFCRDFFRKNPKNYECDCEEIEDSCNRQLTKIIEEQNANGA